MLYLVEKRVVPSRSRPVSRGSSDSTFSPPSSAAHRTLEILPSDPVPLSVLSRPSSSSSSTRPHSPSTTTTRSNSSGSRPHSPSQSSPLGSPSTKRRAAQDGVFLTNLRSSNQSGLGYVDFDDSKSDQSEDLSLQASSNETIETKRTANIENGTHELSKEDAEEERASMEAEQAARRAELDVYMNDLKKNDVVVFPPNFTELMETMEADQIETQAFWTKYMIDQQIDNPWLEDEQLAKGLERIRKLDIILAKKTKLYRELKKAKEAPKSSPEPPKPEKGKHIPAPPQLTQMDEKRLEALLDDAQPDSRELHTPFEELDTLYDIDAKLAEIVDVTEWDAKGLAHLRPTSASSRASYASHTSYLSQSSTSSYSSFLSFASRASRSSQLSKELEKQLEEEEKLAKARMEEIDAKLRELANAEVAIANATGTESEVEVAPPEEIRKLVRMYSSSTPR